MRLRLSRATKQCPFSRPNVRFCGRIAVPELAGPEMDERPLLLGTAPLRLNDLDWGSRAIGRILQRRRSPRSPYEFLMDLQHRHRSPELDAVSELKGHGFEIVRYREERG